MCAILGWLTFGLTTVVCGPQKFAIPRASFYKGASQPHWMSIRGSVYDLTDISSWHNSLQGFKTGLYSSSQLDVSFFYNLADVEVNHSCFNTISGIARH
jgi:predicted heme/steroid binding protein